MRAPPNRDLQLRYLKAIIGCYMMAPYRSPEEHWLERAMKSAAKRLKIPLEQLDEMSKQLQEKA